MKTLFVILAVLTIVSCATMEAAHPKKQVPAISVQYLNDWVNTVLIEFTVRKDGLLPDVGSNCNTICQCASNLGKQNGSTSSGGMCNLNGKPMQCVEFCNGSL